MTRHLDHARHPTIQPSNPPISGLGQDDRQGTERSLGAHHPTTSQLIFEESDDDSSAVNSVFGFCFVISQKAIMSYSLCLIKRYR